MPARGRMALRAHAVAAHVAGEGAGEADDALLGGGVVRLAAVAQAGLRGGVHEDAGALLAEDDGGVLAEVEVALEVDVEDDVPLLLRHVEDHLVAKDAGVVDDDVEAAEGVERLLHHAVSGLEVGDVVVVRDGVAAHLLDLGDDLVGGALLAAGAGGGATEVVDDDASALGREAKRLAAANAASGAGDDGDFAFEPVTHDRASSYGRCC